MNVIPQRRGRRRARALQIVIPLLASAILAGCGSGGGTVTTVDGKPSPRLKNLEDARAKAAQKK